MKNHSELDNTALNSIESETIRFLKIPLIIGVVFIHASWPDTNNLTMLSDGGLDLLNITKLIFSKYLPVTSVPLFFIFSGYLFFYSINNNFKAEVYFSKIQKRVYTLFVPYVFRNIFTLIFVLLVEILYHWHLGYSISTLSKIKGVDFLSIFYNFDHRGEPIDGPLWYVKALMILVFMSPILFKVIKWAKLYTILVLFLLYYINVSIMPLVDNYSLFYFSLGAYLSIEHKGLVVSAQKYKSISFLWAPVFLLITIISYRTVYENLLMPVFTIFACCAVLNLGVIYIQHKFKYSTLLADAVFFIFAFHKIIIYYIDYFYRRLFPSVTMLNGFIEYFVVPIIVITICCGLYELLRRFNPKLLVIVSGNR